MLIRSVDGSLSVSLFFILLNYIRWKWFSQVDRFSGCRSWTHIHRILWPSLFLILCEFFVLLMCDCVYPEPFMINDLGIANYSPNCASLHLYDYNKHEHGKWTKNGGREWKREQRANLHVCVQNVDCVLKWMRAVWLRQRTKATATAKTKPIIAVVKT